MKVTFFINYLNHHQVFVADEMYRLLGDDFRFVATFHRNAGELKGGADYSSRPYCLLSAERDEDMVEALRLVEVSDVCVFGAGNLDWERKRAKTDKLSFEISERWFKRGFANILSPRLIEWWWLYKTELRRKPFYKLCASAYTAPDCRKLFTFKDRCFKWGYFTDVFQIDKDIFNARNSASTVKILWVARFLQWKHPERMLQLCHQLLVDGYSDFEIIMIGTGPEFDKIKNKAEQSGLSSHLKLLGALPNDEVLKRMQGSDIFCFTSDRNEGWGAVLNEAMSNGCCVVANSEIGSVPFLVESGKNGIIYKGRSAKELISVVEYLIDNPDKRQTMAKNAAQSMQAFWNPTTAARNLITLSESLLSNTPNGIKEGPCSNDKIS